MPQMAIKNPTCLTEHAAKTVCFCIANMISATQTKRSFTYVNRTAGWVFQEPSSSMNTSEGDNWGKAHSLVRDEAIYRFA